MFKPVTSCIVFICLLASCGNSETAQLPESGNDSLASVASAASVAPVDSARLAPEYALIEQYGCFACHQTDSRIVGPSYSEVAQKYTSKDTDSIAKHIIKGSRGIWGTVSMPPHPQLKEDEAKQIVSYILNLK